MINHLWLGSREPCLDAPAVTAHGPLVLGRYGGSSSAGAETNEDAALLWAGEGFELVVLADAHAGIDSAVLVMDELAAARDMLTTALAMPPSACFKALDDAVPGIFRAPRFQGASRELAGETAVLTLARKDSYLWWMSVGDIMAYVLHPEYARLGQYAVTTRAFYEWVGRVSTFDEPVASYAHGVKRLRSGANVVLATTDGLLECGDRRYENPAALYRTLWPLRTELQRGVGQLVDWVEASHGRGSVTAVAWTVFAEDGAPYPSA